MTILIEGSATPADARTYRLLPFELPDGVTRLMVRYQFGKELEQGAGIIDIGIFDERGADFLTDGFRGWSGSARREFFISAEDATPGYVPGILMPGTWQICLGLYEIAPEGCAYRVEIDFEVGEAAPVPELALLPLSATPQPDRRSADGWYRGELHCHTYHSDGDSDTLEVIARAEALGLDFLAITDHNVLTQQRAMRGATTPLMLIPGMEVTTYRGHWNVWGDKGWLDFRVGREADMRASMDEAVRRGYLVSCNHPKTYGPAWEYPSVDVYHCVEIWNGPWELLNNEALAFWERHLRAGKRYTAVGGSDNHFLKQQHIARLGHPTTCIYCEGDPSPARLLDALRAGAAIITDAPDGPHIALTCGEAIVGQTVTAQAGQPLEFNVRVRGGEGCHIQLINDDGMMADALVDTPDWTKCWPMPAHRAHYVRAQLVEGQSRMRALTNPIYIQRA